MNRRGKRLFYAEESPDHEDAQKPIWVLCSPILEEKNVSQGVLVSAARALAAHGHRALRFDYEGHGDSEGDTGELGLTEWAHDVSDVVTWMRGARSAGVVLLGCRVGAMLAAMAAAEVEVDRLVAWCPVLNGDDQLQELLRVNMMTQTTVRQNREVLIAAMQGGDTVNILGWEIGDTLRRSLAGKTLAAAIADVPCSVDVLDLVRRQDAPPSAAIAALAAPPRIRVRVVVGFQFWLDSNFIDVQQRELIKATLEPVGVETV